MEFQYTKFDGLGLAELMRKKEVKPEEVKQAALQRIEALNPRLNAVIKKIDEMTNRESNHGIFTNVPMLLKDILQEVKGQPITSGSKLLKDNIAKEDSEFVRQIRETGAVFLGQTNIPEFALMGVTEPQHYGATRNPWNLDFTPGGSSGGSAAAVASGMVPIAGANDGGGSIRIPAAYCGIFGLKPTRGRTPVGPKRGRHWQGASVDHILSRTVRDSAAMLDHYQLDRASAFLAPSFSGNYLDKVDEPFHKPLKVAFSTNSPLGTPVDEECKQAVQKTVKILEEMGHNVEEKEAPVDGLKLANSYMMMYFGEVAANLSNIEKQIGRKIKMNDVELTTWLLGLIGNTMTAKEFVLSLEEWDKAAYAMEEFHESYDFFLTPTTAFPPARIGELEPTALEKLLIRTVGSIGWGGLLKKVGIVDQLAINSLERTPFTQLANLTGQPAMSVPLHLTSEKLPVGVQFVAARGREDLLFQLAGKLEQTTDWIDVKENPLYK